MALLYEAEQKQVSTVELLSNLPAEPMAYTAEVLHGVDDDGGAVDELIGRHADGWAIGRMPAMDRAVLRVAAWELSARDDIPMAVVIDEAVEFAKDYSTEQSGRFVNGVLSAIADEVRSA